MEEEKVYATGENEMERGVTMKESEEEGIWLSWSFVGPHQLLGQ